MIQRIGAAMLALFLLPANAPADMAAAFGARPSIESISLSPDGNSIAYVAPATGQASRLYTVDLRTGESQVTTGVDGSSQRLGGCNWVSNQRLVCVVFASTNASGEVITMTRLVALDRDGSNVRQLGQTESLYQRRVALWGGTVVDWLPGEDGAVLMGQMFVPESRAGTNLVRNEDGYGVVRVDTRNMSTRRAERPRLNAVRYISDGRGNIRIMGMRPPRGETGMSGDVIHFHYRPASGGNWRELGRYNDVTREGQLFVAVDPEMDAAYAFAKVDGRMALHRVMLDGSGRSEIVVRHDQVDVDELMRIGRSKRVVGASFVTEVREAVYFDAELNSLAEQLSRALPNLPLVRFVDSSEDESKLLIEAGSDTDPGRYYIYDKSSRQLSEIMLVRPQLEGVRLAEVRPISFRAADGTMIPGYLTLPPEGARRNLPAIVMPHGGPEARDEWSFDWLAQFFANRGYAVLQPNFRGSSGYGDAWFQENGFQSWQIAIGDVNDAGRWLVAEGIADPSKLAIVGWSYGGYAALQSGVLAPDLFKAVVAIAPVTDLNLLKEEWRFWTNFASVRDFVGSGPHIRQGSPAENAGATRAPVLLFHGDLDRNVGVRQSRLMESRLRSAGRDVELIIFPGLDHGIDDSAARARMLSRSDAFLRATLGIQ